MHAIGSAPTEGVFIARVRYSLMIAGHRCRDLPTRIHAATLTNVRSQMRQAIQEETSSKIAFWRVRSCWHLSSEYYRLSNVRPDILVRLQRALANETNPFPGPSPAPRPRVLPYAADAARDACGAFHRGTSEDRDTLSSTGFTARERISLLQYAPIGD
jgi:hypothetical protein